MKQRAVRFIDIILDGIESMKDYVLAHQITLSEGFLLLFTTGRALWLTAFDVSVTASPGALLNASWMPVFWAISALHFIAFFFTSKLVRVGVTGLYALVWCVLAFLVGLTQPTSPFLPEFISLSLLAAVIAIRLYLDHRANV